MNEKRLFIVLCVLILLSLGLMWYISNNANNVIASFA